MFHWLGVIIVGFIAGVIAKFIMPGENEPNGFIMTTVLGIAGSFVANFVATKLHWTDGSEGFGLLSGVVGAVVILFVYGLIAGRMNSSV